MVEVTLVSIFQGSVPIPLPILEPVTGIDRHVEFSHAEELIEVGFRLSELSCVCITRRKPAADFVYRLGDLTQRSYRLSITSRTEEHDSANPGYQIGVEGIVPLRQLHLFYRCISLPDCTEIQPVPESPLHIVWIV